MQQERYEEDKQQQQQQRYEEDKRQQQERFERFIQWLERRPPPPRRIEVGPEALKLTKLTESDDMKVFLTTFERAVKAHGV